MSKKSINWASSSSGFQLFRMKVGMQVVLFEYDNFHHLRFSRFPPVCPWRPIVNPSPSPDLSKSCFCFFEIYLLGFLLLLLMPPCSFGILPVVRFVLYFSFVYFCNRSCIHCCFIYFIECFCVLHILSTINL